MRKGLYWRFVGSARFDTHAACRLKTDMLGRIISDELDGHS